MAIETDGGAPRHGAVGGGGGGLLSSCCGMWPPSSMPRAYLHLLDQRALRWERAGIQGGVASTNGVFMPRGGCVGANTTVVSERTWQSTEGPPGCTNGPKHAYETVARVAEGGKWHAWFVCM